MITRIKNLLKRISDELSAFIDVTEYPGRIKRGLAWSAPRYGSAIHNDTKNDTYNSKIGNSLRIILWGSCIIEILFVVFPKFISCFMLMTPLFGLILSIIIFALLLAEFVTFRPKIFSIFELPVNDIEQIFVKDYPVPMNRIISDVKISEHEAVSCLKKKMISTDNLRLFNFVTIFIRLLIVLVWYAFVIMFADLSSGGKILFTSSGGSTTSLIGYLYQSFGTFISACSGNMTFTIGGMLIIFGQILIYFSVFVVIIGRFTDYLSIYSNQIEKFVHEVFSKYRSIQP